MSQVTQSLYEGMFLMGQAAGADVNGAAAHIREILDKAGAMVLTLHKWDDRKLAYSIRGQKRGLFLLALFRVSGGKITQLERDCNLSEQILRVLITRGDHMGQIEIDALIDAGRDSEIEDKLKDDVLAAPSEKPSATNDKSAAPASETTPENMPKIAAPQSDVAAATDPIT